MLSFLEFRSLSDLCFNPRIGLGDAIFQRELGFPSGRVYPCVAEVPGLDSIGPIDMLDADPLAGYPGDGMRQLIHRNVLRRADESRSVLPDRRGLSYSHYGACDERRNPSDESA